MDNTIIQGKNPEQAPKKPRVNGINKGGDMEKLLLQNRFWLLGALSLLFIITFIYYLPLRFEQQAGGNAHDDGTSAEHGSDAMGAGAHARHALPTVESLEHLPLRTPADRVDRLSYELVDGIKVFLLEASEFRWEYEPGKWVHVWGYNGQIPAPEIRVQEGDAVRVVVKNNLPDATTVHWHGVDVPWQMDGVAGVTQEAIPSGGEFAYEFSAVPAGTRFYHTHGQSHSTAAQQMDMGLSGAFIITPREGDLVVDRDYTLMLDEWDILPGGGNAAIAHVHGAGEEGAVPDFNTFTINGRVFPYTEPLRIQEGEFVRIRFINAGTAAFHPMHLHGHSFEVVAKDGFLIPRGQREERNTITVNPGETVDILVRGDNPGPWLLHCHHVHHASAGMITLLQYEGYEPVNNINAAVTISKQKGELTEGVLAGEQVIQSAHAHSDDAAPDEEDQDHHNEAPLTNDDHHAGEEVEPHAHTAPSNRNAWWGLLAVSVVLMTLLGLGVNKYLKGT
jgi:FtsP/CotA-like multicopper oxidase with cupredoxin domain